MKQWILDRLKERSTWIGLTTVATAFGASLSPEQVNLIVTAGSTIIGLILTFTQDCKQEKSNDSRGATTGSEQAAIDDSIQSS